MSVQAISPGKQHLYNFVSNQENKQTITSAINSFKQRYTECETKLSEKHTYKFEEHTFLKDPKIDYYPTFKQTIQKDYTAHLIRELVESFFPENIDTQADVFNYFKSKSAKISSFLDKIETDEFKQTPKIEESKVESVDSPSTQTKKETFTSKKQSPSAFEKFCCFFTGIISSIVNLFKKLFS